tara:strand:- start:222 stop:860 length:639 start_codon:yes stop_codon:yes gene_type:complete
MSEKNFNNKRNLTVKECGVIFLMLLIISMSFFKSWKEKNFNMVFYYIIFSIISNLIAGFFDVIWMYDNAYYDLNNKQYLAPKWVSFYYKFFELRWSGTGHMLSYWLYPLQSVPTITMYALLHLSGFNFKFNKLRDMQKIYKAFILFIISLVLYPIWYVYIIEFIYKGPEMKEINNTITDQELKTLKKRDKYFIDNRCPIKFDTKCNHLNSYN